MTLICRLLFIVIIGVTHNALLGQDIVSCDSVIVSKYDKVSGDTSVRSKTIEIKEEYTGGFEVTLFYSPGHIAVFIRNTTGVTCYDQDSKATILFRDESKLSIGSVSDFDCDDVFPGFVRTSEKDAIKQLSTKEIELIRLEDTRSWTDRSLSGQQSKELMSAFACLGKK